MESSDHNDQNVFTQKKRRGRPPKNITKPVKKTSHNKKQKKVKVNDEIILQIPITMTDINNFNDDNTTEKNKEIFTTTKETSTENQENNIFTLADITNSSSDEYSSVDDDNKDLVKKLQEKDDEIKDLQVKLNKMSHSNLYNNYTNKSLVEMKLKLLNNKDEVKLEKTTNRCWWDHHTFTSYPFFIVEKYHNKVYYVYGCFCCVNCALAYNIKYLDDYCVSERHALTIQLFRVTTKSKDEVKLAPHWLITDSYGGPLSIEDFRTSCLVYEKDYIFTLPPISYITPVIEISNSMMNSSKNINSDESENIIIKRSKPLPSAKSTLIETMGLTMEKKKPKKKKQCSIK